MENHETAMVPFAQPQAVQQVLEGVVVEELSVYSQLNSEALDLVTMLLRDKRSAATRRAYGGDLRDFCTFIRATTAAGQICPSTLRAWLRCARRDIAIALLDYKAHLIERGNSGKTINRKMAAVRGLLKLAHRLEMCETDGHGLVDAERVHDNRDILGISLPEIQRLLTLPQKKHGTNTVRGLRDAAILSLLFENGLRRIEVCRIDVGDFSLPGRRLMANRKARGGQKEPVTLSKTTSRLIGAYLLAAGHLNDKGPLFRNLHRGAGIKGNRLTGHAIYLMVKQYGEQMGIQGLRPHKMRHSTGTITAQNTNGDMTKVQEVLGHKDIRTSANYVRQSRDVQGEVTNLLSSLARKGR